ncbi:uncharacterized protein LOC124139657 isoform X1 [Haliotis rufescens]|uniref:uncharacterized protein LOC124139657 isoform X1 n=1 Tax=Haliotis rufescens TaxID=6454 RepID=UPI00201FA66B|nr:uncharacterized protein LOC124139657 isoform X1 [Haliotis rufescens]
MDASAVTELSSSLPSVNEFSKGETSLKEQTNEKTVLMNRGDSDQSADPLHAIDATFRIPLLRDPVNHEDPTKRKIDFSVRVGASLARTEESYVRIIQREFVDADLSTTSSDTSADNYPRVFQKDRRVKVSPRFGITSLRRRRDSRKGSLQIIPPRSYITEETAMARFQRIGRAVQIISGVCNSLKRHVAENDTRTWSSVEMYLHVQDDLNKKLAFNPLNFTMVAPPRKGERLEHLLQTPPSERTAKDIKMILAYIRGHASIHDYPADVQIHMCKCMLYQKYEDRRILLKQGHPPSAFYFILTGSLIVNIEDINPNNGKKFTRTVSELTAGDCFGELALLERSTRTATVICKTTVELLVVLKEDFDIIIRQPLIRQRLTHIRFCQSLVLFEDFPCDVFAREPDDFFYQFIPSDSIIVRDSRECRYLIVVKSGKCSLVAPFKESSQHKERPVSIRTDLERAFPFYAEKRKLNNRPKTGLALERSASDFRDSLEVGLLTGVLDKRQLEERGVEHQRGQRTAGGRNSQTVKRPPPLQKSMTMSNFFDSVEQDRRRSMQGGEDGDSTFWAMRLRGPSFRQMMSKRRIGSRSNNRATSAQNMKKLDFLRENDSVSFAEVAELKQGAVFGLESLVHRPASSLTLVSHGAECLFVSKKLFLQEANIKTLRVVSDMVMSYPSQVFIREQVKVHRDWIKYRRGLVSEVTSRYEGS